MPRAKREPLFDVLARVRPDIDDPEATVARGLVLVDGVVVSNPRSRVLVSSSVVVRKEADLRGSAKLRAAIDSFGVDVAGRVALDVGAAAGGFTAALLERGAARVYAVDAGHGQLLGSLRQDARVVNLEATNVGALDIAGVPDEIGVVTIDVSYLRLSEAVRQLGRLRVAAGADLIGLVKPMFELRLPTAPTDGGSVLDATVRAARDIQAAGWRILAATGSPVAGAKGAREAFVHGQFG
jgi:23S rRNA (cytidine1920-2'-O)/16S rRNA (cytidine1409-2'-O)-methyltransferase